MSDVYDTDILEWSERQNRNRAWTNADLKRGLRDSVVVIMTSERRDGCERE
jgi:hypothetical protein